MLGVPTVRDGQRGGRTRCVRQRADRDFGQFGLARSLLYVLTMTTAFMSIEAEQLVTATGGAGSFIEPTLRQTFKGKQLECILSLPFAEQARILNAQLRRNAGQ